VRYRAALHPEKQFFTVLLQEHSIWDPSAALAFEKSCVAECATGLRYIPKNFIYQTSLNIPEVLSGEGGIRTLGTTFEVRRFSKPLVSASHPPHLDFILLRIKYLG
jgi:hypothetical protein